jgi:acetolactate synthase I/II/III large subunit
VGLPMSALPSGRTSFSRVGLNPAQQTIDMSQLAAGLHQGLADERVTLVRLPLGWDASHWHFTHPLDYLGYDGGAGIGSGPGMLVGAALALRDRGRLPVAILGDGDTMMGISALWTAAHYRIPMLLIVGNNRSYFNDEVHQEKVAVQRGRPVANKAIGQAMTDPDINFAQLAEAQGLTSFGPITRSQDLVAAISRGICSVKEGASVVIDVRIVASYAQAMSSGMTESTHQSE